MILTALVLIPAVAALLALWHRAPARRSAWLVTGAGAHLLLVAQLWRRPAGSEMSGWLAVDALGLIVLTLVSVLFFLIALYAVEFLRSSSPRGNRAFVSCLLGFLAAATLVALSHHLALLWVGMETTTLTLAPLVYHRHDARSLEAVWKYLVLSSVGIGLALLGTFFLAAAQTVGRPLVLEDLVANAGTLQPALLRGAFVFLLVGYGTKMGLAPLHSWKPDTYGEAPGLVGGLMAGALTTCAFLGLLRISQVTVAAGLSPFVQPLFLGFGLLSLIVAAAFMIGQLDLKRLLAYSSVEHMGLLVLGLGLGGLGAYGSVLHALNNGLTKGLMFLTVSNVALLTGTTQSGARLGLLRRLPVSGVLLLAGLFAVTGSPPFGLFVSEFTLLRAAIGEGHPWVAVGMVVLLAVIFVGMARPILGILFEPQTTPDPVAREPLLLIIGPVILGVVVLALGIYIPEALQRVLGEAARALGGVAP